ncbi:hypothetical protein [Cupriavidus necator]|uniref:hypothetical protein n=1 Tax=Cupriavidus necator TaxID=106590 RepID=UPI000F4F413B|nr:hypothetical protein [Cupriavidus necator]
MSFLHLFHSIICNAMRSYRTDAGEPALLWHVAKSLILRHLAFVAGFFWQNGSPPAFLPEFISRLLK